ncbi:DUF4893 domain-containing protein [uncultured Sphingomonas sp.]|uniref:DUF4893 domain-containing protein n=1 Tax=uncultured Sphingomonas sp. TaxID=158754 RepID=UPI0037480CC5
MSALAFLMAALAACTPAQDGAAAQTGATAPATECRLPSGANWREIATPGDRTRLRTWRDAWTAALGTIRARSGMAAVTGEGALLEPDRALGTDPTPPPGDYRCRAIKLGVRDETRPAVAPQTALPCRIVRDGDVLRLTQPDGAQRVNGTIYPDTAVRGVFLGTLALTDEPTPLAYGSDSVRDMAGLVERVADRKWRIVLPRPALESTLDVIEVTPAE